MLNLQRISHIQGVVRQSAIILGRKHNKLGSNLRKTHWCAANALTSNKTNIRFVSSTAESKSDEGAKGTLLTKILSKISFLDFEKNKTRAAAYLLYEKIVDHINYEEFFEKFEIPDTFYSWFVVTELHIWMLAARAMAEGDHGRFLRNFLIEALWADVALRVKQLEAGSNAEMRERIMEFSEQLQAALIAYDEGMLSSDVVLAGALWRRMYQQEYTAPQNLEGLVKYVRKQLSLLDKTSRDQIFIKKDIKWGSIK